MQVSKEYQEFLEEEAKIKHLSFYERLCKISERLPVLVPKGLNKKYQDAIDFCHLKASPRGIFSLAIITTLLTILVPIILSAFFSLLTPVLVIIVLAFAFFVFYYFYDYPFHYSIMFRVKASSEMTLAIVYMTIAMRMSPNIESAVKFAAKNLTGPLAYDLRKLIWDVYARKYDSVSDALDTFINKWKRENEEFTESIYIIKTSVFESSEKREQAMDEAVSIILNGTKERMKQYSRDLRVPVTVLNSMGILLPIIGLVFLPIIGIFLPELIQPIFIALGYTVLLPLTVYWMMKTYLEKRPYTFHQPDISMHPKFKHERFFNRNLLLSLAAAIAMISFGIYQISISKEVFSFSLLIYSLVIIGGVAGGIIMYSILTVVRKLKIREDIVQIENEFGEALFQLGNQLARGIPLETTLKNITPKIRDLKISKMFELILHNIETFGMTFEQAIFDENYGAIKQYPSKIVEAVLRAVTEISKRGMDVASKAMLSISTYLKDVRSVEEDLKEMLSEVTSTMQIQAILLAPLASGIVVSLAAMIMQMLLQLKEALEKLQLSLVSSGPVGMTGSGILNSIINVDKIIPVHTFQLIVGIYMIEVVSMLAIFMSTINNGDENLLKKLTLGKTLLLATVFYSIVLIGLYLGFSTIIPISGLIK